LTMITSMRDEAAGGTRLAVFEATFICRPFVQNSDWHPLVVICGVGAPSPPEPLWNRSDSSNAWHDDG
jgi:hypothetical protein